ncbi:MAG: PadR family transcriptional regulator [Propionibacteriaceae bacterium]|nr:PadR family transcriptional regulator [Propionibacteriaceae bacterium]
MAGDRTGQIRRGVVELAVLGLLAQGQRYGSQIVEELGARPALALTAGTVYPLLSRLLKGGLIDSTWQESPVGPPRKYYRLTPAGRAAEADLRAAWASVRDTLDDLLKEAR